MPTTKTPARKYIEELCERFPETPSTTLARKAYNEARVYFNTIEHARDYVRRVRGKIGDANRKNTKDKVLFDKKTRPMNPYKLPETQSVKRDVYKLPKVNNKVLVLSDIHIPYQDNKAIKAAIEYGKKQGVNTIYLNGDIIDFYQLSFHEKDPRKRSFKDELEDARQFFKWLKEEFPSEKIYFIPGNHEARLERWLRVRAPELLDFQEWRLDVLLKLRELDIHFLQHKSKVYFGKLMVEHGDKLRGAGGVNPARTLLLKFKRPVLCGHFHRTSSANSKVYDDTVQMAWSTGCLCELEPEYFEVNEHNHGFAIVDILPSGKFKVDNKQIIEGQVY
jgi:predicted phosphodiesterase